MPVSVIKINPTDVPIANEWVGTMDGFVNAQIQPQARVPPRQLYTRTVAKDRSVRNRPRRSRPWSTRPRGSSARKAQLALCADQRNRDTLGRGAPSQEANWQRTKQGRRPKPMLVGGAAAKRRFLNPQFCRPVASFRYAGQPPCRSAIS
jgi:membrane fusion protein (multidrug efflux system)